MQKASSQNTSHTKVTSINNAIHLGMTSGSMSWWKKTSRQNTSHTKVMGIINASYLGVTSVLATDFFTINLWHH